MDSTAHSMAPGMVTSLAAKTTKVGVTAHMAPAMGETTTAAAIAEDGALGQATAIEVQHALVICMFSTLQLNALLVSFRQFYFLQEGCKRLEAL